MVSPKSWRAISPEACLGESHVQEPQRSLLPVCTASDKLHTMHRNRRSNTTSGIRWKNSHVRRETQRFD